MTQIISIYVQIQFLYLVTFVVIPIKLTMQNQNTQPPPVAGYLTTGNNYVMQIPGQISNNSQLTGNIHNMLFQQVTTKNGKLFFYKLFKMVFNRCKLFA